MATNKKTNPTPTNATASATAVVLNTEAAERRRAELRDALNDARTEVTRAQEAYDEAEAAEADRAPLDDPTQEFLARGTAAIVMERAKRRLEVASARLTRAEKTFRDNGRLTSPDTARFAEVFADSLRKKLARTADLGTVEVIPVKGSAPDHSGRRTGEVQIKVTAPKLDSRTTSLVIRDALGGGGQFHSKGDFEGTWAGTLVDAKSAKSAEEAKAAVRRIEQGFAQMGYTGSVGEGEVRI